MNVTDAELESLGINEIRAHFKSLRVMFQQTREELLREASQEDQSFLALPDNGIIPQNAIEDPSTTSSGSLTPTPMSEASVDSPSGNSSNPRDILLNRKAENGGQMFLVSFERQSSAHWKWLPQDKVKRALQRYSLLFLTFTLMSLHPKPLLLAYTDSYKIGAM